VLPADSSHVPSVSVVIPAYRAAPYIAEALGSVLSQTFTDYEIVVVNDGSPDTSELEQALEPYRSRIVYLVQENLGPSAARNRGIRAARADWVAFLDADDAWEADFLDSQMAVLRQDPSIDLLYADTRFVGNSIVAGRSAMEFCPSTGEVTFQKLVQCECTVFLHTTVVRREVLLRAGLFDTALRHSEDLHLWLRIAKQGGRIAYQRRVLARYRRHGDSLSADGIAMREGYLRVLEEIRNTLGLTAEEMAVVDQQIVSQRADWQLQRARREFRAGRFSEARGLLQQANSHFRRLTLRMAILLLSLPPGLLRRLYIFRQRRPFADIPGPSHRSTLP
jgi:GT2 family glycosyltransferase